MASGLFKQLLEEGKALAEEFSSKKLSPKKRKKNPDGSNVSWRKWDRDGNIVPQHIRKPSDRPGEPNVTKQFKLWDVEVLLANIEVSLLFFDCS